MKERPRAGVGVFLAVLAVGAAAGGVYSAYRRDIHAAIGRVSSGSRVAVTPCGPIEYAEVGGGAPVLLVHGAGGGFDQVLPLAHQLAARGFRAIAVSRFGYLRTPLPEDASAAAQADAHACLLDALAIPRAAVIGISAGAPSSIELAIRQPERCVALVLLAPATFVPRPDGSPPVRTPAWTQFLFDTALRSDFLLWLAQRIARPLLARAILATPPELIEQASPEERARVDDVMRRLLPVTARRLGLLNDAAVTSSAERPALERILAPTLAISAADDLFGTFESARYTAEQAPNGRFVGYPSGGHLWVGRHADVLAEIQTFLIPRPAPLQ